MMIGNKPNRGGGGVPLKRIAIIGSPEAGKSTFARQLGDITGIEALFAFRQS
ncbi:hypothetical protein [Alicyclobacillus mengziensis]|uniref:Uncharacterized protein n=1 Tax=Alicyclobacillus mengziensis TaxID=2931921 RepID=A0A9X7Z955_9BACL|nr:hypothetical protein [Alicyclobacillus mengziensis]QSO49205.1 hypothetical protein JZ786_09950 [Alicyclobacillus mengziensis]